MRLRVEFLLKTDSGYLKDTGVKIPWQPLGIPFAITPIGQRNLLPQSIRLHLIVLVRYWAGQGE